MKIKDRIVGALLGKQAEMASMKHPHKCLGCEEIVTPARRMSVLNLVAYIVIGIIVGGLTLYKIGFVVSMICILINAVRIKPACIKCSSTDLRIIGYEELKKIKAEEAKTREAGGSPSEPQKEEEKAI